jgi:tRNA (guanine-N7-)-methyltransferase
MKARYLSLTPFIAWKQAERPINWEHHFGHTAPLEVEIGFGNGEFLVRQAREHPQRHYIGLELEWTSVQRGLRKIAQTAVPNVRLVQVEARLAMQRLFRPLSLQRVYALFPCPWPKERHAKRRLFSRAFLQLLNSRLVPHAEVQIVTDDEPYAQWVLDQIPESGFTAQWQSVSPRFSTKYERKWQAKGQKRFYEIGLRKERTLAIPFLEDVTLQARRVVSFMPEAFHPASERGDIAVEFKDFLFDPQRQRGMVWVFTTENTFCQDFWIEIVRGKDGWSIRPARGCSIVPTVSVQRALDLVRDAIVQEKADASC